MLSYFSLFTSLSTLALLCVTFAACAVRLGSIRRIDALIFALVGSTLAAQSPDVQRIRRPDSVSFLNTYYVLPRLRTEKCLPDSPDACAETSRLSRIVLVVSAVIYAVGFLVAFVIGPILAKLDSA